MAYYIFNSRFEQEIFLAMTQAQGGGFYDFKPHQKLERTTNIPNSNTDNTPINLYRTVFLLETSFASEDSLLKQQAEAIAELYTDNVFEVHQYLNSPDIS